MQPTILIIEDDPSVLALLRRMCASMGADVLAADCGAVGLGLAKTTNCSGIILNYGLPDSADLDLLKQLRLTVPNALIAVTTGRPTDALEDETMFYANEFWPKPFGYTTVAGFVQSLVQPALPASPAVLAAAE